MASIRFALLVLVTGVLFLRPAEIISSLEDQPVYEVCILCCLVVSAPVIVQQLTARSLGARPITLFVLGLLAVVPLSHLTHLAFNEAWTSAFEFLKVVLSYLLLVGVINTSTRLRWFLRWLVMFIVALTVLALLQYHGVIDNEALAPVTERMLAEDGSDERSTDRLCGAGIFANPNDLSRILVVGIGLSLFGLGDRRLGLLRGLYLAVIGLFGYALVLTYSRGGFIALLVTIVVLFYARFRLWKTLALGALVLPALFLLFQGRQTDITIKSGTGQQRIQLWSDGFVAARSSPLFGIGMGKYSEETGGLGAHNSFVEVYVELGFVGGSLFLAAQLWSLGTLHRLRSCQRRVTDLDLQRLRGYLLAIIAGYAAGMLSSSRCYAMPTYFLLGLVAVYARLASRFVPAVIPRTSPGLFVRFGLVSVAFVVATQLYILAAVQWE